MRRSSADGNLFEKSEGSTMIEVEGHEHGNWHFEWLCEKWSDDAVKFVQRKLEREDITHIPAEIQAVSIPSWRDKLAEKIIGRPVSQLAVVRQRLMPVTEGITSEMLRKYIGDPEEVVDIPGNLLVNEGIQRLLDLAIAAISNQTAANAWGNTNSYLGVGDSSTAEAATQTELQAATNRFYKGMNATFPSRSNQTVTWQADFTTSEANFVWAEWSVSAGATTASGAGFTTGTTNLNRKVQSLGTKSSGTWTLSGQLTIS